ncbi:GFA family protein [Marinicella sp. W31]|uniref:GFA family protein n=1 Tax=Marinicella sp. W31 TaxID=3023713 RepID=UPI00375724ED
MENLEQDVRRSGACLCGAVRISVDIKQNDLGVCHCANCRKWSGGPFFEVEVGSDVTIEGEQAIQVYASSNWAERGFCKVCGSHLFIRDKSTNAYGIPPGLFEDDSSFQFNRQVFSDQKPVYYSFSNHTKNITSDFIYKNFPQVQEDI